MLILILAYLGGILTIVSPCILPVLPFVFARAGQPFSRSGLPLLAGMTLMFVVVASLATVGGNWVVKANQYGRWLALLLIALFALSLLLPRLAERLMNPLVMAGNRLAQTTETDSQPRPGSSFLIGIATGLLWAPCAGPILGLVLTGAALQGASIGTSVLLLAYAAGAATSLAVALLLGGKVFAAMKRSLGAGEWIRRALGATMLVGVVAIALGLDTGVLAQLSTASTANLEQKLVDRLSPANENPTGGSMQASQSMMMQAAATHDDTDGTSMMSANPAMMAAAITSTGLPDEGGLPSLDGAVQWLNSPPLTTQSLRGKVVLVDFWTYSCINCLRTLPYIKAWADKYRDQGLVVIGVHAPEFAFERDVDNVKKAMRDLGITYPVAIDNNYAIWRGFNNKYWPAHYFIDAQGRIRHHHFGEGGYMESERVIQQLLREAGSTKVTDRLTEVNGLGVEQAANMEEVLSPETYIGSARAERFVSTEKISPNQAASYNVPTRLALNQWGLVGTWSIGKEHAALEKAGGRIVYQFHARDLHLVLGPGQDGKPIRFKVMVDGKAPGEAHGEDISADGMGTIKGQRLYQLVRQKGDLKDRLFSIEFLDPGVSAYAFTFG